MAAALRLLSGNLPVGEIVFFRSLIAAMGLATFYLFSRQFGALFYTNRPLSHLGRCLTGVISTAAYIEALSKMPLVTVTVLVYSTPIITVALAAWLLKEHVRIYRWSAIVFGFIGILIMLVFYARSSISIAGLGMALGLLSAVTGSLSSIQIRQLTKTEKTQSIVFYFYLSCMFVAALTLPFWWVTPNLSGWLLIIVVGVTSVLSQLAATDSLRYAGASTAIFFDYTIILWSFLIGYYFFGELPGIAVYVGGALIIASGIFIIYREQKLGSNLSRAP